MKYLLRDSQKEGHNFYSTIIFLNHRIFKSPTNDTN